MLALRATRQGALWLGARSYAAAAPKPEVSEYEAESSSAPHRRLLEQISAVQVNNPDEPVLNNPDKPPDQMKKRPQTPNRAQKLSKAKKIALALRDAQISDQNIALDGREDEDSKESTTQPTSEELNKLRPWRKSDYERWDPRYYQRYHRLKASIDRAFVKSQLATFISELGLATRIDRRNTGKSTLIRTILTSWGWPTPMLAPAPEPEGISKDYPLTPAELFFFSRDRDVVRSVISEKQLSLRFVNQTVKGEPVTILSAKGGTKYQDQLAELLAERQESMKHLTFSAVQVHNFKIDSQLLRAISNLSGAYIEEVAHGQFRASSSSDVCIERARSMMAQAALQLDIIPKTRHLMASAPSTHANPYHRTHDDFALLPFIPSPSSTLPWYAISSLSKPLFRLRTVGNFALKVGKHEMEQLEEKLLSAPVSVMREAEGSTLPFNSEISPMEDLVSRLIEAGTKSGSGPKKNRLTFTFGHLLIPSQLVDTTSLLVSPLPGRLTMQVARTWLTKTSARPLFVPTLTPVMIHFGIRGPTQNVRRIRYRSESASNKEAKYLTFDLTHEPAPNAKVVTTTAEIDKTSTAEDDSPIDTTWHDDLEKFFDSQTEEVSKAPEASAFIREEGLQTEGDSVIRGVSVDGETVNDNGGDITPAPIQDTLPGKISISGETSVLNEVDLMIPDRPVDSRLTSSQYQTISTEQIPPSISSLAETPETSLFDAETTEPALSSPSSISFSIEGETETYNLISDEELVMIESVVTPKLENGTEGRVILRWSKSTPQGLGPVPPTTYTQLELADGTLSPELWRELASITRVVDTAAIAAGGAGFQKIGI